MKLKRPSSGQFKQKKWKKKKRKKEKRKDIYKISNEISKDYN